MSRSYDSLYRDFWLALTAGAIITLVGLGLWMDTMCSSPPAILYRMCVDPAELVVIIVGSAIMLSGSVLLLARISRNEKYDNKRSTTIVVASAIIVSIILITSSLAQIQAYATYITKTPLHVEITGLENTYNVGDSIDFIVKLEGYGYDCGFPTIFISKIEDEASPHKTIWSLKDTGGSKQCSLIPIDISKTVHIGGEEPLIINETGSYVALVEGSIGRVFDIVDYGS